MSLTRWHIFHICQQLFLINKKIKSPRSNMLITKKKPGNTQIPLVSSFFFFCFQGYESLYTIPKKYKMIKLTQINILTKFSFKDNILFLLCCWKVNRLSRCIMTMTSIKMIKLSQEQFTFFWLKGQTYNYIIKVNNDLCLCIMTFLCNINSSSLIGTK